MENLILRRYEKSDHETVLTLHRLALEAVGAYDTSGNLDKDLDSIEEVYLAEGEFLLAYLNDEFVGMGAFHPVEDRIAEVKRLRVYPGHQRKGIGSYILKELETRAKNRGFQKLVLDTSVTQIGAQKLFRKKGFTFKRKGKIGNVESLFFEKEI